MLLTAGPSLQTIGLLLFASQVILILLEPKEALLSLSGAHQDSHMRYTYVIIVNVFVYFVHFMF